MISVVLVEPEHPGNIGAVARVMKNFGFSKLVLINPKCNHLLPECRNRAKHAQSVLEKATVFKKLSVLDKYDYRIATTGKLGDDYNIRRTPLTSYELAKKISKQNLSKRKLALVFGRESCGLTNEEISKMDYIVNIPTSKYSALNLSHAVSIILYDRFQHLNPEIKDKKFTPISRKEINVLSDIINKVLRKHDYLTEEKRETQKKVWKHILTKSMLTRRESFALMGFFRKFLK
jgi:TrmH family RNA methyltransferase